MPVIKYLKTKEHKLKIKSLNLNNKSGKEITLDNNVFGISPRSDIMARVIRWQLAKRRLGNHSVKTRSEIKMTTAKMYKQKGTGKARHGSVLRPMGKPVGKTTHPLTINAENLAGRPKCTNPYLWRDPYRGARLQHYTLNLMFFHHFPYFATLGQCLFGVLC